MNEILPFALGPGENVVSQEQYDSLGARTTGFPKGLLPSAQINKALRQSAFVASALAQLVADTLALNVLDDGDRDALVAMLQDTITAVAVKTAGAMTYKGTWNAATNSPALASGVGTKGFLYTVSVAGATNLDGVTQWNVGDKAVFNGAAWEKIEGQAAEVLSVAGRTGAVVLAAGDITDSGSAGRQVLQAATAAAIKTLLAIAYGDVSGLGTAAQNDAADFDPAGAAAAAQAASQPFTAPVNDSTAAINLVASDTANFTRTTNAGANTVTITSAQLANVAPGAEFSGIQAGAGQTTITPGPGVTLNATPGLKTRALWSAWTIKKVSNVECDVFGDLSA